ncbi:MAG: DUF6174 domain-containing protein [Chloroflexi bacterium]|nr:DUF6174 domain-containing protein [Chloroflexota bacterium]
MLKRMTVAMAGVAMLVLIAACGADNPTPTPTPLPPAATSTPTPVPPPPTPTPTASTPGSPQAALLQAQERWEHSGVADYAYTGAWVCFCPEAYLADTQVTVSGGSVTAVDPADPGIDAIPAPERFVPIDDLFALIQDAITNNAARIEVSYDETYGYPTSLFIDHDERMADEETSFAISSFSPR